MANLVSKFNKTQSDNLICGFNKSLTVFRWAGFYKVDKTHIRFFILNLERTFDIFQTVKVRLVP